MYFYPFILCHCNKILSPTKNSWIIIKIPIWYFVTCLLVLPSLKFLIENYCLDLYGRFYICSFGIHLTCYDFCYSLSFSSAFFTYYVYFNLHSLLVVFKLTIYNLYLNLPNITKDLYSLLWMKMWTIYSYMFLFLLFYSIIHFIYITQNVLYDNDQSIYSLLINIYIIYSYTNKFGN